MVYEVIVFPESNSAEAFGLSLSGKSPTEIYVLAVEAILKKHPELVGQKETHFTTDSARASQYTGTTRETEINGRSVYIKTGFSTKDKWKNLERICQLAGISFSIGEGGTVKPTPTAQTAAPKVQKPSSAKSTDSKKATTDIDYAALSAKYAAQPVHDDYYSYTHVCDNSARSEILHDSCHDSNLAIYKGWYYYVKPLNRDSYGLFRRLVSKGNKEMLLTELSPDDVGTSGIENPFRTGRYRVFNIHKDIIYFNKDRAIQCMNLDGSGLRKLNIHKDESRLFSPFPLDGGLVHLGRSYRQIYFYNLKTGTDKNITPLKQVLGTCGSIMFFVKPVSELIAVFDARDQSVVNLRDWMPALKKKNIVYIDCRHEIIYYTEKSGNEVLPIYKSRIYGVNFSGELVDVWEVPKLPDMTFDRYSVMVFNGELYGFKVKEPTFKENNGRIQNDSLYRFTRSGDVELVHHVEEGGLVMDAGFMNAIGNAAVVYVAHEGYSSSELRWTLIPTNSTVYSSDDFIILHDPVAWWATFGVKI